jgi:hypothetical protein
MLRGLALVLVAATGCAMSADLGVIQHAPGDRTGGSGTAHLGMGGAGKYVAALSLDTRVDVAEGGSRWAAGATLLGGVPIGRANLLARAGVWRAIVSGTPERAAVPTFELGAYIPLREVIPDKPEHGTSTQGVIFGVRDDVDTLNYVTVFVGVAMFIIPGY